MLPVRRVFSRYVQFLIANVSISNLCKKLDISDGTFFFLSVRFARPVVCDYPLIAHILTFVIGVMLTWKIYFFARFTDYAFGITYFTEKYVADGASKEKSSQTL